MPLLERESALDSLGGWFAEARAGRGRLVLVGGEAGVGKTTLVNEFALRQRPVARVLWGACDPLTTPRPLGPLADVAPALGGRLDQLLRDEAPREVLFGALLGRLRDSRVATVLVIEDLHWADEAPDSARLAHHAEGAGDGLAVLAHAPVAARRAAALGAHREAAAQYGRALRFADGLAPAAQAELLEGHSYECYLTDQLAEATASRARALGCWRALRDRRREGDTLRWLSRLAWFEAATPTPSEPGSRRWSCWKALPPARNWPSPTATYPSSPCWPATSTRRSPGAAARSVWPSSSARPRSWSMPSITSDPPSCVQDGPSSDRL